MAEVQAFVRLDEDEKATVSIDGVVQDSLSGVSIEAVISHLQGLTTNAEIVYMTTALPDGHTFRDVVGSDGSLVPATSLLPRRAATPDETDVSAPPMTRRERREAEEAAQSASIAPVAVDELGSEPTRESPVLPDWELHVPLPVVPEQSEPEGDEEGTRGAQPLFEPSAIDRPDEASPLEEPLPRFLPPEPVVDDVSAMEDSFEQFAPRVDAAPFLPPLFPQELRGNTPSLNEAQPRQAPPEVHGEERVDPVIVSVGGMSQSPFASLPEDEAPPVEVQVVSAAETVEPEDAVEDAWPVMDAASWREPLEDEEEIDLEAVKKALDAKKAEQRTWPSILKMVVIGLVLAAAVLFALSFIPMALDGATGSAGSTVGEGIPINPWLLGFGAGSLGLVIGGCVGVLFAKQRTQK